MSKSKVKSKKHKGDGRQNPSQNDETKFHQFRQAAGVKVNKSLAKHISTTPITHQSGKGTRGLRQSINGDAKVTIIRYGGSVGYDFDRLWRFIAAAGFDMTTAVFKKAYRQGENGTGDAEVSADTVKALKAFK